MRTVAIGWLLYNAHVSLWVLIAYSVVATIDCIVRLMKVAENK